MIVALAGRRIDAPDAISFRFPMQQIPLVRERLRALLVEREASVLVCAAACGSDLLALEAAGELGLRRRIVLPFARDRFRDLSVIDRPGEWGALFDKIIGAVEEAGDLVVLRDAGSEAAAFVAANSAILDEAIALSSGDDGSGYPGDTVLTVIVWEGKSRGDGDVTAAFADEARVRGLAVAQVLTR